MEEDDDVAKRIDPKTCTQYQPGCDTNDEALRDLEKKAAHALGGLALSSRPDVRAVKHPDGAVLVVGVERSPHLVACSEPGGLLRYYMRAHDGTVLLPDLVAADLLVGRRARPSYGLVDVKVRMQTNGGAAGPSLLTGTGTCKVTLELTLRNEGLVWLDAVQVGIAATKVRIEEGRPPHRFPEDQLRALVLDDQAEPVEHRMAEPRQTTRELPPFIERQLTAKWTWPEPHEWAIAIYAVAPGHPPTWWSVRGGPPGPNGRVLPVTVEPSRGQRIPVYLRP